MQDIVLISISESTISKIVEKAVVKALEKFQKSSDERLNVSHVLSPNKFGGDNGK